ncbi:MAG: HAMP domain-containing histidine kinase [Burkholderiales bacterium]|nr:HAMP domain-containing histidine kinase [Burkholderiales bacterium]
MMLSPVLKLTSFAVVPNVSADICLDSYPGPLGQVLTNLLNNSLLHGFDGREHGQIEIGARLLGDGNCELWVSDDGVGIAQENVKRIFDPFFTTKLGTGGSGLGLNITHNIVTGVLGGRISVESSLGQGCRFTLILPLVAPHNPPAHH